jgi:hypothetical protein
MGDFDRVSRITIGNHYNFFVVGHAKIDKQGGSAVAKGWAFGFIFAKEFLESCQWWRRLVSVNHDATGVGWVVFDELGDLILGEGLLHWLFNCELFAVGSLDNDVGLGRVIRVDWWLGSAAGQEDGGSGG